MKIIILINVLLLVPYILSQDTETASDIKDMTTVKIEDNEDDDNDNDKRSQSSDEDR